MKNTFLLLLSFISIGIIQGQTTQDTLYVWKSGQLVLKQSIKPADMDSITFMRPVQSIPSVIIGTQVWTSKNLDVTTYRDGTPIPQVTDKTEWSKLTTGAWCYYDNKTENGIIYGKLYNWYAVAGIHDNNPNTPNKILAPIGWHVATDSEWIILTDYLGGEKEAGGKLKVKGWINWAIPNYGATNSSGFSALGGGIQNYYGGYSDRMGYDGYWWSSSEDNITNAWSHHLSYSSSLVDRKNIFNKAYGLSVRCLKD